MFICEIRLFDWYFPQFYESDMSKYGYLEVDCIFDWHRVIRYFMMCLHGIPGLTWASAQSSESIPFLLIQSMNPWISKT